MNLNIRKYSSVILSDHAVTISLLVRLLCGVGWKSVEPGCIMVAVGMMDESRQTDLVKKAQSGDRDSYGQLVDLYGGAVLATAYSRVGNYAISQDIAQDALLLGLENLPKLRQPRRFGLWLRTITKNLCKDWHRSEAYRKRLREDSVAVRERLGYVQAPSAAERMVEKEMHSLIDESLGNLPVRDRESIVLYYFEGKSIAEAAKVLDISPVAMKKRLERARERLRDQLTARVEAGLLDAAKGRQRISARILAAMPLGASYPKIAPVAPVLPTTSGLRVAGLMGKIGGTLMEINKAAAIATGVCAALVITAGGVYVAREKRASEEAKAAAVMHARPVSAPEQSSSAVRERDVERGQPVPDVGTRMGARAGTVSDTGKLVTGSAGAQMENRAPGSNENASISGRVTDTDTNPIEGAELTVTGSGVSGATATSGDDGHYRLTGVSRNIACRITASASGYGTVVKRVAVPGTGDMTGVDFVLQSGATVAGFVMDTGGDLIADAQVMMQAGVASVSGRTDNQGRFHVENVAPGTYGFAVFKGGCYQKAITEPLTVAAGDRITGVEIIVEAGLGSIEGFAVNERGDGISAVNVLAFSAEGSWKAQTDASGFYRVEGLGKGAVGVTFGHPSYADAHLRDIPVGTMNADVVMVHHGSISGTVIDAATLEPVRDFTIKITTKYQNPDGISFEKQGAHSFGSETGEFVIENVQPGIASLIASADGYVQQEVSDVPVESGRVTGGVEFCLPCGHIVRGTVVAAADSHPVAGANVYLGAPDWRNEQQKVKVVTAGDGSFVLKQVPAGEQILAVRHPNFSPTSVAVTVHEQDVADVIIELGAGGMITGYVTENDVASPGASLQLSTIPQSLNHQRTTTDADGFYEFKGLATGSYRVITVLAGSPGSQPLLSATLEVGEGRVTQKDFDFRTGTGVIEGYITENGEPVSGIDGKVLVSSGSRFGEIAGRSPVDANGFYRVEGLAADSYRISASAVYTIAEGDMSGGRSWSQGGGREIGRAYVQLEDGETVRVDIETAESAP